MNEVPDFAAFRDLSAIAQRVVYWLCAEGAPERTDETRVELVWDGPRYKEWKDSHGRPHKRMTSMLLLAREGAAFVGANAKETAELYDDGWLVQLGGVWGGHPDLTWQWWRALEIESRLRR